MGRFMPTRGFTLLELLIAIVVIGILAVVVGPLLYAPVKSYFDTSDRAELVYSTDAAMRRLARDARNSLPYSVRLINGGTAVEMIEVLDVGRYRENGGGAARKLAFNGNDTSFNLVGSFERLGAFSSTTERLVVFNLGSPGFDVYAGDSVVSNSAFTVASETYSVAGSTYTEHQVTTAGTFPFLLSTPSHRIFVIGDYIAYGCSGTGLYRLQGYATPEPASATIAGGSLETDDVTACSFNYDPGSSLRPGVLTMILTVTRGGESVTLQHQVHIPNAV
ncbi:MAG: type II secretion system protein [Gammaproteobacteria bacterium]|nr:type II secretion system protein [Gammaproteobacteria bacterium]